MNFISLNGNRSLLFEPHGDKVRLVICEDNSELVCRKESVKKLNDFLKMESGHLFKGRLQLLKYQDRIEVEMQHTIISSISAREFEAILNKSK